MNGATFARTNCMQVASVTRVWGEGGLTFQAYRRLDFLAHALFSQTQPYVWDRLCINDLADEIFWNLDIPVRRILKRLGLHAIMRR